MIDDKRLAEIEERARTADHRCIYCGCLWRRVFAASVIGDKWMLVEGQRPRPCCDNVPIWLEVAAPAGDVPDLCASLREAWHLLWVMSRDQDAYLRGKEDGRRECVESLGELAALMKRESRLFGGQWRIQRATTQAAADLLHKGHDLPPPMPPDAMAAENARLRDALRRIVALEPEHPEFGTSRAEEMWDIAIAAVPKHAPED